ncbi:MAG: MauE/DoxX family redox-associated membrane protein [Steroidobacteraceae bacterium]
MMGEVSMAAAMQPLMAQLAIFQALLLAASAVHKAARWSQSQAVVRQFAGVPASLAASALGTAIVAELIAGALLIVPAHRATGAVSAAVIWTCYLLLIVRAILQDRRDVDCGCSFGPTSRPLGAFQVVRNAVLASVAMLIAWVSAASGSVPSQASQVLGGIALLALYGALDQVMALRPLRGGEVL